MNVTGIPNETGRRLLEARCSGTDALMIKMGSNDLQSRVQANHETRTHGTLLL